MNHQPASKQATTEPATPRRASGEQSPHGPFAAVIFDLDGTLVDSTAAIARSWAAWEEAEGVSMGGLERWHGQPAGQIVRQLIMPERWDAATARIAELELHDTDDVVALPGASEALSAIPDDRLAIATSSAAPLASRRIAAAGLTPPPTMVTADQVSAGKPDPASFLLAAERLGRQPEQCLVLEDSASGVTAARAAGCVCLALATTTPAAELIDAGAVGVIADLAAARFEATHQGVLVRY